MKNVTNLTIDKLKDAFYQAEQDRSGLREYELNLYGVSGQKIRHTINSVCAVRKELTYVELGVYRSSTLIAASFRNNITAYGIDDYTIDHKEPKLYKEDGWNNARMASKELINTYIQRKEISSNTKIVEADINDLDFSTVTSSKIDVLHYDLEEHHANIEQILRKLLKHFDDYTVVLISNWNSKGIKNSFTRFMQTPDVEIIPICEKISSHSADTENWYSGFAGFLIKKEKSK